MKKKPNEKIILCYSGGLDSSIARIYLKPDLIIYFDLGTKYSDKEKKNIDASGKFLLSNRLKLTGYEFGINAYIPFRNLFLAMLAYLQGIKIWPDAKKIKVAIIGVKGDKVEDKSPEAYKKMSRLLNLINKPEYPKIEIFSPFWKYTKGELVKKFKNQVNFKKIISCYSKEDGRCGECPACFRFWVALESNGIECWNWFKKDIRKWRGIKNYIKNLNKYDKKRQKEIKMVLKKYKLVK